MRAYATNCVQWLPEKHRLWIFFNNDFYGYAIENARMLEKYIDAGLKG